MAKPFTGFMHHGDFCKVMAIFAIVMLLLLDCTNALVGRTLAGRRTSCCPALLVEKGVLDTINDIADRQAVIAMVDRKVGVAAGEAEAAVAAAWDPTPMLCGSSNGGSTTSLSDPLVKMLAERALVTMFLAQNT
uniref:MTD1m n=1 Tax=Volvox carteri f. nagariensis TaxID=3068 RepID=D9CJ58_VOLCA|nr:MTD1m [Volvox carteri f. nagariensis]